MVMGLALTALAFWGWEATAMAADKAPAVQPPTDKGPKAIIKTKFGEIEIKLFPDKAPKLVEDSPFLDGKYTVFGQVVKGMGFADKVVTQPRDARDNPTDRIEMTVTVVE